MSKPAFMDASFLSVKAIGIAVLAALILYAGFFIYVLALGSERLEVIESGLASYIVTLEQEPEMAVPVPNKSIEDEVSNAAYSTNQPEAAADILDTLQKKPLLPAPYEGLTEEAYLGLLPVIGPNNLKPFNAYKKPFTRNLNTPSIAIVIKDFGLSAGLSKEALDKLPSLVTFLLSPYSYDPKTLSSTIRENGHEFWLTLPMENENFPAEDPGARGILTLASLKYNQDNYEWVLSRALGYAGVALYSDDAFDEVQSTYKNIVGDIYERGLGLFELNDVETNGVAEALAVTNNAAYAQNTLSPDFEFQSVRDAFETLKRQARDNGKSVGVMTLTPALLNTIKTHIAEAQEEGFAIVPLSALADTGR